MLHPIRFSLLTIFLLLTIVGAAQRTPPLANDGETSSDCLGGIYHFQINDNIIQHGKEISICENFDSLLIAVYDQATNLPLDPTLMRSVVWRGAEQGASAAQGILKPYRTADPLTVAVEFLYDTLLTENIVEITVRRDAEIVISNSRNNIFEFDNNEVEHEVTYYNGFRAPVTLDTLKGIDFYFQATGEDFTIKAKTAKKADQLVNLKSSWGFQMFSPEFIRKKRKDVAVNGGEDKKLEFILGCKDSLPLAMVTTHNRSIFRTPIRIVRVCELDANGRSSCPRIEKKEDYLKNINDFYGRIGINFTIFRDSIYEYSFDYDSNEKGDGRPHGQNTFYAQSSNPIDPSKEDDMSALDEAYRDSFMTSTINMYIVHRLDGDATGVAMLGKNSFAMAANLGGSDATLVHEIGHAVWGLNHPRDFKPDMKDKDNFMFWQVGGKSIESVKIRSWQWHRFMKPRQ